MLTDADNRVDLLSMQSHPWLAGEPFGEFASGQQIFRNRRIFDPDIRRAASSLYVPPPLDLDITGSPPPKNTSKPFDFSAFFSSPGLSILRSTPQPQALLKQEEEDYWIGMTFIPAGDAFDQASDDESRIFPTADVEAPPTARKPSQVDLSFKTPLRRSTLAPFRSLHSPAFPFTSTPHRACMSPFPPTSSSRARRMLSDVEAWKEMQEHAFEVGMTAKKTLSRPRAKVRQGPEDDFEDELEERRRKLERDVEKLEAKYAAFAPGSLV